VAFLAQLKKSKDAQAKLQLPGFLEGTCEWFLQTSAFNQWLHHDAPQLLLISGGPGMGKSVLANFVSHALRQEHGVPSHQILMYICKGSMWQKAQDILSAFLHDLLYHRPMRFPWQAPTIWAKYRGIDTSQSSDNLYNFFKAVLSDGSLGSVYCLIDGIEEIELGEQRLLVSLLRNLFQERDEHSSPLKSRFLITSRPTMLEKDLKTISTSQVATLNLLHSLPEILSDIQRLLDHQLPNIALRTGCQTQDLDELKSDFTNNPACSFLWISLVLPKLEQALKAASGDQMSRTILTFRESLLFRTDSIYASTLECVEKSDKPLVNVILSAVLSAQGPLTLHELACVIALVSSLAQDQAEPLSLLSAEQIEETVRRLCDPFVTIAEDRIRIKHESAREFLTSKKIRHGPLFDFYHDPAADHLQMGKVCLQYLQICSSDEVSQVEKETFSDWGQFTDYAVYYWPTHLNICGSAVHELWVLFAAFTSPTSDYLNRWWKNSSSGVQSSPVDGTLLHQLAFLNLPNVISEWRSSPLEQPTAVSNESVPSFVSDLDLGAKDANGYTALVYAAAGGYEDVIKIILELGADPNIAGPHSLRALHFTAGAGNVAATSALLAAAAKIEIEDDEGETPLFAAVRSGNEGVALMLMDHGANTEHVSKNGWTLLHHAAGKGCNKVLRRLLKAVGKVDLVTSTGATSLHFAANESVAALLLSTGASVDVQDIEGICALHIAAENGDLPLVRRLIKAGGTADLATTKGMTALHYSAWAGQSNVFRYLIQNCFVNLNNVAETGWSPLALAASNGHVDIVRHLLVKGANVNPTVEKSISAISCASEEGHLEIVQILLKYNANLEAAHNEHGPLSLAISAQHYEVVKALILEGANVEAPGENDIRPLHMAAYIGNCEIARLILDHGAELESCTIADHWTPLYVATWQAQYEVFELLLQRGSVVNTPDKNGWTPLHQAARNGRKAFIIALLSAGARADTRNRLGCLPLHVAAQNGHLEALCILIYHRLMSRSVNSEADARMFENLDMSSLNLGLGDRYKAQLKLEVCTSADGGITMLYLAVQAPHIDVVRCLLAMGADVRASTMHGVTALHPAAWFGHLEVVELLLQQGAEVDAVTADGITSLHEAVRRGHITTVQRLLRAGANVNCRTNFGATMLHGASVSGNLAMIAEVLEWDLDIESRTGGGYTPLHLAAKSGHVKIVDKLLDTRANPNARSDKGWTALHMASYSNHDDIVQLLLPCTDPNATSLTGWTPLHYAVGINDDQICKLLLDGEADPNICSVHDGTPLNIAARFRRLVIVEMLLQKGAKVDLSDAFGRTALDWAAGHDPLLHMMSAAAARSSPVQEKNQETILLSNILHYIADLLLQWTHQKAHMLGFSLLLLGRLDFASYIFEQRITKVDLDHTIHHDILCDECKPRKGIVGQRFVCTTCASFDLCETHRDKFIRNETKGCQDHIFLEIPSKNWDGLSLNMKGTNNRHLVHERLKEIRESVESRLSEVEPLPHILTRFDRLYSPRSRDALLTSLEVEISIDCRIPDLFHIQADASTWPRRHLSSLLNDDLAVDISNNESQQSLQYIFQELSGSQLVLEGVLHGFRTLQEVGFCTANFSILAMDTQPGRENVAMCKRISATMVQSLVSLVQECTDAVQQTRSMNEADQQLSSHIVWDSSLNRLLSASTIVLKHLGCSAEHTQDASPQGLRLASLELCSLLATILALGLTAYSSSHAGDLLQNVGLSELQDNVLASKHTTGDSILKEEGCPGSTPRYVTVLHDMHIIFSRRKLACLNGLVRAPVWVFSFESPSQAHLPQSTLDKAEIYVSCCAADLEDLWGPASFALDEESNSFIRQMNLDGGCIMATESHVNSKETSPLPKLDPDELLCHYFTWTELARRGDPDPSSYLRPEQRMLIGHPVSLERNGSCQFDLEARLTLDEKSSLRPIEVVGCRWRLDTINISSKVGSIFDIGPQFGFKRLPERSQKSVIAHSFDTDEPWPKYLEYWVGLEVSACTRIARRVMLWELFNHRPVQRYVAEKLGSELTKTGRQAEILDAFKRGMDSFWPLWFDTNTQTIIKKMLKVVLVTLAWTGETEDGRFSIWFTGAPHTLPLNSTTYRWTTMLKEDSHCAVFAFLSENCLRCTNSQASSVSPHPGPAKPPGLLTAIYIAPAHDRQHVLEASRSMTSNPPETGSLSGNTTGQIQPKRSERVTDWISRILDGSPTTRTLPTASNAPSPIYAPSGINTPRTISAPRATGAPRVYMEPRDAESANVHRVEAVLRGLVSSPALPVQERHPRNKARTRVQDQYNHQLNDEGDIRLRYGNLRPQYSGWTLHKFDERTPLPTQWHTDLRNSTVAMFRGVRGHHWERMDNIRKSDLMLHVYVV